MSNLSLTTIGTALPHTNELNAIDDEIQQLKDWIFDLEKKRHRLRAENRLAELHMNGFFTLADYAQQYGPSDSYAAGMILERQIRNRTVERVQIGVYRFLPQHSDSDWCAEPYFAL